MATVSTERIPGGRFHFQTAAPAAVDVGANTIELPLTGYEVDDVAWIEITVSGAAGTVGAAVRGATPSDPVTVPFTAADVGPISVVGRLVHSSVR